MSGYNTKILYIFKRKNTEMSTLFNQKEQM